MGLGPDLRVTAEKQRYEHVRTDEEGATVRFLEVDGDFTADLELDSDGLLASIRPSRTASPARKWLLASTKGEVRAAARLEPLPYAVALVALTDEQRAMLQLLLEGGQSYEDIGSLLGIGPDEVRSRACPRFARWAAPTRTPGSG